MRDVRYAFRLFRRQPAFTATALLTLALGIGAATAMFSVFDAAFVRPLPYPNPEQLVRVAIQPTEDGPGFRAPSIEDLRTWLPDTGLFSSLAMWRDDLFPPIIESPGPERLAVRNISENYLQLFGVSPVLGRTFTVDDMRPGAPPVVIIGHGYWQTRFNGDRGALGQTIRLADGAATVVGVLPADFQASRHVWRPFREPNRRGSGAKVYGRLRPGVTPTIAMGLVKPPLPQLDVRRWHDWIVEDYVATSRLLAAAVVLLLAIAAVNLAGLLIGRAAGREAEIAVRTMTGASRGRLVRQLLTESLLLAIAGGAFGIALAWASLDLIAAGLPLALPEDAPLTLNRGILLWSLALSTATGLAFGVLPALQLSRRPTTVGRSSTPDTRPMLTRGIRTLVITAEVAIAVELLLGGALMLRSFEKLQAVDIGFDPEAIVTMEVTPLETSWGFRATYYAALLSAIQALPEVEQAGAVDHLPLGDFLTTQIIRLPNGTVHGLDGRTVLPGYFEAMGHRIVRGRPIESADMASGTAIVLSENAAKEIFGSVDVVGRSLEVGDIGAVSSRIIVGIVGDIRQHGPRWNPEATIYTTYGPNASVMAPARGLIVVVRPNGKAPRLATQLRHLAESIGPSVLVDRIRPGADWLSDNVRTVRRRTILLVLFGALGLALALVGVFGLTAYVVSLRSYEFAVRAALGATPARIFGETLRDTARPVAMGIAMGIAAGLVASRAIEGFLFETSRVDPVTFVVVPVMTTVACVGAALLSARRAAYADPASTLRTK